MSEIKIWIVDAFSEDVFSGNPAAVCCLDEDLPESTKQKIAAEMNLSETSFAVLRSDNDSFTNANRFDLKWFTPIQEVDLCGHATLATAAVIFLQHKNQFSLLEFETKSGVLKARQEEDNAITLDFPLNPPCPYNSLESDFAKLIVGNLNILEAQYSSSTKKLLIRLSDSYSRNDLENLKPCTQEMVSEEKSGLIKGVIVTLKAKDGEGYDFYSRYFAPWVGIPEDPVTGSAHTVLGPYWEYVLNKKQFAARQCSKRGGDLKVKIVKNRVEITGHAVFVLEGSIKTGMS